MRRLRKACICAVALVCMSATADAQVSGSFRYIEPYSVEGLAVGAPVAPDSWLYKRFSCRPIAQYANSTWCTFSETKGSVSNALTIVHLYDNIVTYINKVLSPAFLTNSEVNREIERLSHHFNSSPRIYRSPYRPGFPGGIIATWGDIKLQPLTPDDLAILAQGKNPNLGVLADYLINVHESARAKLPVYSLNGGAGYVWIARFDKRGDKEGKGRLRFFAADPSQMNRNASVTRELSLADVELKKAKAETEEAKAEAEKAKAEGGHARGASSTSNPPQTPSELSNVKKAKSEAGCKTDWKQCVDNEQLANKWEGWSRVAYSCKSEAKDYTKYGAPEFPWLFYFSTYNVGRDYIENGLAVAIEPDAKFDNMFDAKARSDKVRSRVTCFYDLRSGRVVDIQIEKR